MGPGQKVGKNKAGTPVQRIAYFNPYDAATLDRLEAALNAVKKEIRQNASLDPTTKSDAIAWIERWQYGPVGPTGDNPWNILQMNQPPGPHPAREVAIDIPHSQEVGYIFQKHLGGIGGLRMGSRLPATFGPLEYHLLFRVPPSDEPLRFIVNPFDRGLDEGLNRAFNPPQSIEDYLPKSRVQIRQETREGILAGEKDRQRRNEDRLKEQKFNNSANRYMQPETIADMVKKAVKPKLEYDEESDTYTETYVDSRGQMQARIIPAWLVSHDGKTASTYSLDWLTEQAMRLVLPIDSIENLVLKYQENDPKRPVGFWDWAWVVVDVGLTVTEVKVAAKLLKISKNSKYFLEKEARDAIDRQIEEQFAGDAARTFAAKRYWRRKFLTQPKRFSATSTEEFVEKAAKVAMEGGSKYETRLAVRGTSVVTRASGWQMTKTIALTAQATFMTGVALDGIARATELMLSPGLPDWVLEEHPDWKRQGLSEQEMKALALQENRLHLAAIFGTFETLGLSSKAIRALLPKLKELLGKGVQTAMEGKDPTKLFQKEVAGVLEEGGVADVPAQVEKELVKPLVKIVQAIAKGAKAAGRSAKWLLASPPGEMGVADAAFLTYWWLSDEQIEKGEQDLVQNGVLRKATEHVYAPYQNVGVLGPNGTPIENAGEAEREKRQNLNAKFRHYAPEQAVAGGGRMDVAFLLEFVPQALTIDMDDAATYARVTQGTPEEPAIPPQRFNRFVLLERELGIVQVSPEDAVGDYKRLEDLLLRHYQPGALDRLYGDYKGQALDLWLDVEATASRWLANPQAMERELPASVREEFVKEWKARVKAPPGEMEAISTPNGLNREDKQMMAAMRQVLSYVLWGYMDLPKREKTGGLVNP